MQRRKVLQWETVAPQLQQLFEYDVEDVVNTEIAEQTFSKVAPFGHLAKLMAAHRADFFLAEMLTAHSDVLTGRLLASGANPSLAEPPYGDVSPYLVGEVHDEFLADDGHDLMQI